MEWDIKTLLAKLNLGQDKEKTLKLAGVVALIAISLYFYIFIRPTFSELSILGKDIRMLRADIKNVEDALAKEGLLQKRLEDVYNKALLYEKKLPAEHEIPILLEELSTMAKLTYVKILGINPLSPKRHSAKGGDKKPYSEIPIAVTAQSGYHQLGAFINRLEKADRFMKVSDIDISGNTNNKRVHRVELVVSTYILLDK